MKDLPLKFWMPGDVLDAFGHPRVRSVYYSGFNFRGVLLTRNNTGDVWSAWTTNAHGVPSEVQQGTKQAARDHFAGLITNMINEN